MFGDQVKKFRLDRLKAKLKGEKSIFKGGKPISAIVYEGDKVKTIYQNDCDDAMHSTNEVDVTNSTDEVDVTEYGFGHVVQDTNREERLRRIEAKKNSPEEVAYRKAKAARNEELQGLYEKWMEVLDKISVREMLNPDNTRQAFKELHKDYLLSTRQYQEVKDTYGLFIQLGRESIHPDDHSPGAERLRAKYAEQDRINALYEDYVKGRSMLANRFLQDYEESIRLRSKNYYHTKAFDAKDGYLLGNAYSCKAYTHEERVRYYMPTYKYFIDGDEDHELYKSYINNYRTYGGDNWEGPKSYMLSALDGMPMHVAAYEGLDIPMHRANHHFMYFFYVRNIEASLKAIAYVYPELVESTLAKVQEETSRISSKPWREDAHYMCPVHIYKDVTNHVSEILDEALRDLYVYLGEELFENPHTTNHLRALVGMSKTFYSAWAMTLQWDVESHTTDDRDTLLILPKQIALEEVYYMLMVMVKNTEQILMDEIDSWPVENLQWNHEVVDCLMAILEDHKKRSGKGEFLSWTDLIDLLGEYFARHEDFRDYEDELESFKDRNWDELTQEEITAIVDKMYVYESMYKGIERIFRYYAAAYRAIVDREKRNYRVW